MALTIGVLAVGFSGILVSWADAPGAVNGFYRMAIAALAPFYFARKRARGQIPRKELLIAIMGGLFFACDLLYWNSGILIGGATNPTLLGNTAPVWVGLGAKLLFRERLNRTFRLGLMVATGVPRSF